MALSMTAQRCMTEYSQFVGRGSRGTVFDLKATSQAERTETATGENEQTQRARKIITIYTENTGMRKNGVFTGFLLELIKNMRFTGFLYIVYTTYFKCYILRFSIEVKNVFLVS